MQLDDSRPEINQRIARGPKPISKAEKRFTRKVLKAVNGEEARGTYRTRRYVTIQQNTADTAKIMEFDDTLCPLEFFTPGHFVDAAAVLFTGKPITTTGYSTRTIEEYDPDIQLRVLNSYALFNFKNHSQHVTTVEMYVMKSKGDAQLAPRPTFMQDATVHIRRATGDNAQTNQDPTNPMWRLKDDPNKLNEYEVTLYTMKFDPGERCVQKLPGPFAHNFKPVDKFTSGATIETPVYLTTQAKGCGMYVILRVLNELQPVVGTAGDTNPNTVGPLRGGLHRGPHLQSTTIGLGCIALEITTDITLIAPEGTAAQENDVMYNHNFNVALPTANL